MICKKCDLVFWKHDDGWDCYQKTNCYAINGKWIPKWFDDFIIEDAPTKNDAMQKINSFHVLGICLITQ